MMVATGKKKKVRVCASMIVCRMSNTKEPQAALLPKCSTYNRHCHSASHRAEKYWRPNDTGHSSVHSRIQSAVALIRAVSNESVLFAIMRTPPTKNTTKAFNGMFVCFTYSLGNIDLIHLGEPGGCFVWIHIYG